MILDHDYAIENFNNYISENSEIFEESENTLSLFTDDMQFELFANKMLEGLDESTSKHLKTMFDRERATILEESSDVLASPEAISFSVAAFPILVDLYSDPLLQKIVTVYPSSVPVMSIPRIKFDSIEVGIDGTEKPAIEFPTAKAMVRVGELNKELDPVDNLYTKAGITNKNEFRLNKRNLKITKITVLNSSATEVTVDTRIKADARGNLNGEFVIVEGTKETTYSIHGSVDMVNGNVQYSIIKLDAAGEDYELKSASFKYKVNGNGNGKATIKGRARQSIIDVDCGIEESFEIEDIEEVIQDWKSIYNMDIISQIKGYVKDQMKLNKDYEVADLLDDNIELIKKVGQFRTVDFDKFKSGSSNDLRPANIVDIFKNLLPAITALMGTIKSNTRMTPRFLVCGTDTASVLSSLQEYTMKLTGNEGVTGQSNGTTASFNKLEIIASDAIDADMIHLVTKSDVLAESSIVEVSHKPLYIITETTNSIKRTFIKSRNWMGLVRPEALGAIQIKNYEGYLSIS